MRIDGAVALVTGADCGIGTALVRALLARGAAKVYGASLDAGSSELLRFVPVRLDVAWPGQLKALARELGDVSLIVNHEALGEPGQPPTADAHAGFVDVQQMPAIPLLQLIDAFAPVLATNGGGAVVNVVSMSSMRALWNQGHPDVGSRTSDWAMRDGLRSWLAAQGTQLLYFRSALVDSLGNYDLSSQRIVVDHIASRVLDWVEANDGAVGINRPARAH